MIKKLIASIAIVLSIATASIAQDLVFKFSYDTNPVTSYVIYADDTEFCWFLEEETTVDPEAVTPSGYPEHTILCQNTLDYGPHSFYMTAIQYGVESNPSPTVEWEYRPVSSEMLMPVIIEMYKHVAETID